MEKISLIIICSLISLFSFSQENEKIKYRKLEYNDFTKLSINDTSAVIIDVFFDKKDNSAISQMSFFPITALLTVIPITTVIGAGTSLISFPLFLNGSYMLVKYRKKKLYMVLTEYAETKTLPKWVRKKANRRLAYYDMIKATY